MPDFRLYYKTVIIKTVWYLDKNRHIDQRNRIENPERDPQLYSQYSTKQERLSTGEKNLFSKWFWEYWTATCRRMKLGHSLRPDTKINKNG